MRKYAGTILFFVFLILIIPTFVFVGQRSVNLNWSVQEEPPSISQLMRQNPEAYADNDFYLIKDVKTGETLALTPADYIKGVVAAEMPISFHTEALKAQAVAAHTYALRQIDEQLSDPDPSLDGAYLSTDSAHFQAYLSPKERKERWGEHFDTYDQKLSDAVEEVIQTVMVIDGEPIIAAFHSISSGMTESAANVWGQEVSYLAPVKSEGDELSPHYETTVVCTEAEVANTLRAKYEGIVLSEDRASWLIPGKRSESGTILEMKVGDQDVTGREIRELFLLKSADFTVSFQDGSFTFDCVGYGHGVGMSQYGADYLARQGMSYEDILTHYYTGISFTTTAK